MSVKGNKYLLGFKLVRSNYISNRYNFVPVDWEKILGHILGEKEHYQMLSAASEILDCNCPLFNYFMLSYSRSAKGDWLSKQVRN